MKIVVLDDDPTGSQTVHGCLLLLHWDVDVLRKGLRHPSPLLFILANTRALAPEQAAFRNREICSSLRQALAAEGMTPTDVVLVSRGDSTLRGHGVLEPEVIAEELGPFDATLHVPAFLEGGRTTVNGVHLLDGKPVHATAFGQDRLFGYSTSDLAAWLEEKSGGQIQAQAVQRLSLAQLDAAVEDQAAEQQGDAGSKVLRGWLASLDGNQPVVVDAERAEQLGALAEAVRQLVGQKRFLFRSAASLLKALAEIGPQPLSSAGLAGLRRFDRAGQPSPSPEPESESESERLPGLVMVGSHVPLADSQLACLLEAPECSGVELPVPRLATILSLGSSDGRLAEFEQHVCHQLRELLSTGRTPVLFTSRGEVDGMSPAARLSFGMALAQLMARLGAALAPRLGYLIIKGGITTHTLLAEGLALEMVQLEGQILPGLSLVRPLAGEGLVDLPILTFPGNLGDETTLLSAWRLMEAGGRSQ